MPNLLVDRAANEILIGPDWALNMEICDILNHNPGLARSFVKGLKKRIRSKNPKVQLLALMLLETVLKNCGDMVHMHVADKDIPHRMVKIVKKKPDFHVKEKILTLIETWQEAFGGPQGRYPQFFIAYQDLLRAGIAFPKIRAERSTPISTTQTRPSVSHYHSMMNDDKQQEKLKFTNASEFPILSLADIRSAFSIKGVLAEMLNTLEPRNKEGVKEEVIINLVEQCHLYRQRVVHLVNSTSDEELLCQGLALNDNLQNVLAKYDALAIGISKKPKKQKSLQALVDIGDHEDINQDDGDESNQRPNACATTSHHQAPLQQLLQPAPHGPNGTSTASPRVPDVDLLSGEEFGTPSAEKSLGLVPANEPTAASANQQNVIAFSDMLSTSNSGNNNNCTANIEYTKEPASHFQLQQQTLPFPNGSPQNLGVSVYEQGSFHQGSQSSHAVSPQNYHLSHSMNRQQAAHIVDQGGALPPPPWEAELAENSQPLILQHQLLQNGEPGEIIPYSSRMQGSQAMGMYFSHDQACHLSVAYTQSMQGGQLARSICGQQPESQLYGHNNTSYFYSNPNELSQRMYGLSMQDSPYMNADPTCQRPSSSSYLQQPMKPLKPEDNLFGDLVSIAKSKPNKPTN